MSCNLHYMFPTAVGMFKSENHEEHKRLFFDRMPKHCIPHESGSGLITGESSGKVYLHTDKVLNKFFQFVSQCVEAYLDKLAFDRSRVDINIVKTWISVTNESTVTPVHMHATSHLSFVYYMKMPNDADAIAFQVPNSPNEPYPFAFADSSPRQRTFVLEWNPLNSNRSILKVQEGQLLVFPSHLNHGTVKVGDMGDEQRVALAGDVLLVFNEEAPNYATGVFDPRTWRKF